MLPTYPRWIEREESHNLRAVAPRLYVGAEFSPGLRPEGRWAGVVDLFGTSELASHGFLYQGTRKLLTWSFDDGDRFPHGCLDAIGRFVRQQRARGPVLLHCHAGLSRSASAAYAMMRLDEGLTHDEALRRVKIHPDWPRTQTLASARRWIEG
jgi:hypothetical protein